MNLHDVTVTSFLKMLANVDAWLDKAEAHAKERGFEVDVLLASRLAPDQYPLLRQIQSMCDAAKGPVARLVGREPPVHADNEKTWAEARARVKTCEEYLKSVTRHDFQGAEARVIPLPFMPGKGSPSKPYVEELALPNFYFHASMTYAILRHNGVPLGKADFIGHMTLVDL